MSQAKVDQYKKEKANRQQAIKKQKIQTRIEMSILALVCAVFVGWVGFSVYDKISNSADSATQETVEFDNTAVDDYVSSLGE